MYLMCVCLLFTQKQNSMLLRLLSNNKILDISLAELDSKRDINQSYQLAYRVIEDLQCVWLIDTQQQRNGRLWNSGLCSS